ncbi:hypothetical protein [Nocardioides conyzicola]|uniref:STAS domain-containing protein n=1 Tax=Nocardioides conyzicola TaxID=1651781 RepID=A0ABP8XUY4_9ACTN
MSTLSYEPAQRRLRVSGACGREDAARLREAVSAYARPGETLIVDLTAVTDATSDVGRALLDARRTAACRVTLLRKSGSPVDSCLRTGQPGISSERRG